MYALAFALPPVWDQDGGQCAAEMDACQDVVFFLRPYAWLRSGAASRREVAGWAGGRKGFQPVKVQMGLPDRALYGWVLDSRKREWIAATDGAPLVGSAVEQLREVTSRAAITTVIPGFHPDPTICRVGNDYFLATSSFEYFPGAPIFRRRDLVTWDQIGNILTRRSQFAGGDGRPSGGIFGSTLRYHNGEFWFVTTNMSDRSAPVLCLVLLKVLCKVPCPVPGPKPGYRHTAMTIINLLCSGPALG